MCGRTACTDRRGGGRKPETSRASTCRAEPGASRRPSRLDHGCADARKSRDPTALVSRWLSLSSHCERECATRSTRPISISEGGDYVSGRLDRGAAWLGRLRLHARSRVLHGHLAASSRPAPNPRGPSSRSFLGLDRVSDRKEIKRAVVIQNEGSNLACAHGIRAGYAVRVWRGRGIELRELWP